MLILLSEDYRNTFKQFIFILYLFSLNALSFSRSEFIALSGASANSGLLGFG